MKLDRSVVVYMSLFLILFVLSGLLVVSGVFTGIDNSINNYLSGIRSEYLNNLFIFITNIASNISLFIFVVLVILILFWKKRYSDCLFGIVLFSVSFVLSQFLKLAFSINRPIGIINESGYSFPSGHALKAMIFFGFIIYLYKDQIKNRIFKYLYISFCIFFILLIGFSRIYLGVHWFSDILGGYLLGLFLLCLCLLIFRKSK